MPVDQINKFLMDVPPDKCFWIHDGPVVRNIYELVKALTGMDDKTFSYHVNDTQNDFSGWIRSVLEDDKLADSLLTVKDKKTTINKIQKRIASIEKDSDKSKGKLLFHEKLLVYEYRVLIVSFVLGLIVGIAIGIIAEHYSFIPRGWF